MWSCFKKSLKLKPTTAGKEKEKKKTYLDAIQNALAGIVRGGRNLGLSRNGASADVDKQEVRKRAADVNPAYACVVRRECVRLCILHDPLASSCPPLPSRLWCVYLP